MQTQEFAKLHESIELLKSELMDFSQKQLEPYSKGELLKCRAFVVFSHAEMQVYWEAIAKRILQDAKNRWINESKIDGVIGSLLAYRRKANTSVSQDPLNPHQGGNLSKIIEESINLQYQIIRNNNGIKRSNVADLLVPVGVHYEYFSEPLLIQLDKTGSKRGDLVHKSSDVSIRMIRDPFFDEQCDIDNLLSEIKIFDKNLCENGILISLVSE